MVNAYAQDLGIQSRELACIGFVRRDLACSDGCPSLWKKHQYDVFAEVVAQLDVLVQMRGQGKIRSCLTDI